MDAGTWVLVVTLVAVACFGVVRAATDGRFRGTHRVRGASERAAELSTSVLEATPWADKLGAQATLVQFSSAFCAPCRATRHILAGVAAAEDGVEHLEIDAEHHLGDVRRLGVLRTPTTLILDSQGREVARAVGAPRREQVLAALAALGT